MQNCSDWPTQTPTQMQMGCKPILSVSVSVSVSMSANVNTPLFRYLMSHVVLLIVIRTKATGCASISHVCMVRNNRVVVSSKVRVSELVSRWKLVQYHLQTGEELSSAALDEMPWGVEAVRVADRPCIAVSFM